MDKKILKDTLSKLTAGEEIDVTFRGNKTNLNGRYSVVESKVDRGKMGSRRATLKSLDGSTEVILHTKHNDEVLNITAGGTMYGSSTETDEPRSYPKDVERGNTLKELFKTLKEGQKVNLSSDLEPTWNGEFSVVSTKVSRGKFGQVILSLKNSTMTLELWSYKHAGAIKELTVVN